MRDPRDGMSNRIERDDDGIGIGFWVKSFIWGDVALDVSPPVVLDGNAGFNKVTTLVCCQLHSSRHAVPGTDLISCSLDDPRKRISD